MGLLMRCMQLKAAEGYYLPAFHPVRTAHARKHGFSLIPTIDEGDLLNKL